MTLEDKRESAITHLTKTQKTFTGAIRTRNLSQLSGLENTDSLNNDLLQTAEELNEKTSVFSKM